MKFYVKIYLYSDAAHKGGITMQEGLRLSRDEIIICYKDDVAQLMRYLSWLQEKSGTVTSGIYIG